MARSTACWPTARARHGAGSTWKAGDAVATDGAAGFRYVLDAAGETLKGVRGCSLSQPAFV